MDIKQALIDEHSKPQTLKIVKYVGNDSSRFKELMNVFLNGEYRLTQRSAWPLSEIAIEHNELIKPYYSKLIIKLQKAGEHPAIPRNILRIFQEIDIPVKYHGILIDLCFKFIMELNRPIAVRAFAITVAANISSNYPELKNELIIILEDLKKYPQQPAITSRIKSAYKQLNMDK
ncbi:MAG: hypothetical protein ACXVNM_13255 [Bacteroidia bacterium]